MRCRALPLLALFLVACGSDPVQGVAPKIQVEDEDGAPIDRLAFGDLPVDDEFGGQIFVHALTAALLEVEAIDIEGEDAKNFAVEERKLRVGGRTRSPITVSFRPTEVGELRATLVIRSNDPHAPKVEVELVGKGIDSAIRVEGCLAVTSAEPDRCTRTLVYAPDTLDMGDVVAGTPENARITVTNLGRKPLELESVEFEDPEQAEAWGFKLPDRSLTQTIGGQSSAGLILGLHPPQELVQRVEIALIVRSSDRSQPEIRFPVVANVVPNAPPEACVRVKEAIAWNGGTKTFEPGERIVVNPGDGLVFDARVREGCSGDPEDGEDVELTWILESADGFHYEVEPDSDPFLATFHADTIGAYQLRLEVTDSIGQVATTDADGEPAIVEFWVEPQTDIGIEIRWPGAQDVDLDIHLVRRDGFEGIFGSNDFYWNNKELNWGSNPPLTSPRLAVDDKGARMVESALLNGPEKDEIYSILVHLQRDGRADRRNAPACSGSASCGEDRVCSMTNATTGVCMPPVEASVRLFLERLEVDFEALGFNPTAQLGTPCDTWHVGDVIWSDPPVFRPGSPSIYQEGDGVENATCFLD